MKRKAAVFLLMIFASPVLMAQQAPDISNSPPPVEIRAKTNKGDLPYRSFYRIFGRLLTLIPLAPRVIDPVFRMSFAQLGVGEQDAFLKPSWNVAIVGQSVDVDVPVIRGGYFLLPSDEQDQARDASIMFNSQTQKNFLAVAWKLRLGENNVLKYQDFEKAFQEVAVVQGKIPWYSIELGVEKRASFNALKACFSDATGALLVDGKEVPTVKSAYCRVYTFDPALATADAKISFTGPLEIVVLEDARRYETQAVQVANK